jgi:hypothetical protein
LGYLSDYNNWKGGRWDILNNISWGSWGYLGKKSLPKIESGQLEWNDQIRKMDNKKETEGVYKYIQFSDSF